MVAYLIYNKVGRGVRLRKPKTIGQVQYQVVFVLGQIRNLMEGSLDIETEVLNEGPGLVEGLMKLIRPVIKFTAGDIVFRDSVGSNINSRGFFLRRDVVLLSDGTLFLNDHYLASSTVGQFVPRYLQAASPRQPVFMELVEDLVEVLTMSLRRLQEERVTVTTRLDELCAQVRAAIT